MTRFANVLVCFATTAEAAAFRKIARNLAGVRILITGIGPKNAEAALTAELARETPDLVISSGFAGGLDPQLPRCSMVFESGNPDWERRLTGVGARRATFVTLGRIATTTAEKRTLRERSRADVVEMESGVLRTICAQRAVPFVILRVISDAADEDLPLDFNLLMDAQMRLSYARLAGRLLRSPGKTGELMRFQKKVDDCGRRQATALASFIVNIRAQATD